MKIVFLIPELCYSGAPKILAWVANQMAQRGHCVTIIAFFSERVEQQLHKNVIFKYLNVNQSKSRFIRNSIGMLKTILKLRKMVNEENPDVVVSFLDSVGYVYVGINRLFDKHRIVVSERVDPYQYSGLKSKLRFWLMGQADKIVFQTEGAQKFFAGEVYKKSTVIPNPVIVKQEVLENIDKYKYGFKLRDNRIVTVGRLSIIQKRQDVLIKAFEIIHKKHPEITLHIYGDGSDYQKIKDMITEAQLTNAIFLEGKTYNVEKDIYSARAFVLSSDFEGIPNALIEAMSIGLPCVSTDCSPGGAALLIKDAENGFLVSKGDVIGMSEKLIQLIENEQLSNRFSDEAIKISEIFSQGKIANLWENCFMTLM